MELLFQKSYERIANTPIEFKRYLINEIEWNDRLIGIRGARGVGKTTMILQHIKENLPQNEEALYISLDDIYFRGNKISDLADDFVKNGGKYLFLDEVHKYPDWSVEIKNIYDNYVKLQIVFTGSSLLEIYRGDADLSRRVSTYHLPGLSFREYLNFDKYDKTNKHDPLLPFSLKNIINNHLQISREIKKRIEKPLFYFKQYLNHGYFPFYKENVSMYHSRLAAVINTVLESDLIATNRMSFLTIGKIKQLLYIIATSVPFKPNIAKISEQLSANRTTVMQLFELLQRAEIINLLRSQKEGMALFSKPEKIYLNNTNLIYALTNANSDIGNIRETFFYNQTKQMHQVRYTPKGDFIIDKKYTFEIGGKNKTSGQIQGIDNAYIAADGIETGFKNKIPLWLFGFLY